MIPKPADIRRACSERGWEKSHDPTEKGMAEGERRMSTKDFCFKSPQETKAFIEGVKAVNDPTFYVEDVVVSLGGTISSVDYHVGSRIRSFPVMEYVVVCNDEDDR